MNSRRATTVQSRQRREQNDRSFCELRAAAAQLAEQEWEEKVPALLGCSKGRLLREPVHKRVDRLKLANGSPTCQEELML